MDQSTTSKKIVIVEDNEALSELYKIRLDMEGYTTFIAYNGIIGLYFIQKELPDLVLLDLMVPDIAGDQILLRMRGSQWGKDIKVIIMSNLSEVNAPAGLRELGIVDYVLKADTSHDDFLNKVRAALGPAAPTPAT